MSYQSEAELENNLLKKLEAQGYERVNVHTEDELKENFKQQISNFNKKVLSNIELTDNEFNRVYNYFNGKSVFICAQQLRDKFLLERDDGSSCYLSFLSPYYDENIYQVTNQISMNGKYKNRYDVTILCNGLPVVQIELKRAGVDITQAINQVNRYRRHSYHGLFKCLQLFIVSNSVETKYFANTDENIILKSLTFYWANEINDHINNLSDFTEDFLRKSKLNDILTKYMILVQTDKKLIVMRSYQIYETEAIVNQAINTSNSGFIDSCTGSGKTLVAYKSAQLLCQQPTIKKVFFLVDRSDLDVQTTAEFNYFEPGAVDATTKTDVLVKQIKDKNTKLICTTIQKMAHAIKNSKYESIMSEWKNKKVIFIVDECHRSQFGKMHTDIKKHFQNAQYIGLTGTPRFTVNKSEDGRTTADVFGKCLFSYKIKNGIFDHNILGFNIEYISTYKGQYDENDNTLVEDINRKEVLESEERVSLIANHITQHYSMKSRIGGNKYTAIFAVSSIEMLARYYDEFKKIDHNMKIAAIFSYGTNEDLENKEEHSRDTLERIIKDYNQMFDTNFSTDTYAAYNADISQRMKVKKSPEIDLLIVVNMYLTGFDSKPLNTLYVDKNLEWHTLLQAYSRTNRVEKETKQFGNIVCYRNLKKKTDDALKLFSGDGDIDGILLKPYEYYEEQFKCKVDALHQYVKQASDVDKLESETDQKEFVCAFRDLAKTLLTLETFVDFDWTSFSDYIDEQTYEEIKSRYITLHEDVIQKRRANEVSILNDIDFNIEIIENDRVNVSYILNLMNSIHINNKEKREKDVQHILEELKRTDSPKLKRKVDLIKQFLFEELPYVTSVENIINSYLDYEEKQREEEIKGFASSNNLETEKLKYLISEYEFSELIDDEYINNELCHMMGFLQRRKAKKQIKEFIVNNCLKYQA